MASYNSLVWPYSLYYTWISAVHVYGFMVSLLCLKIERGIIFNPEMKKWQVDCSLTLSVVLLMYHPSKNVMSLVIGISSNIKEALTLTLQSNRRIGQEFYTKSILLHFQTEEHNPYTLTTIYKRKFNQRISRCLELDKVNDNWQP